MNWFNNMKMKTKILSVFSIVIFVIVFLGYFSVTRLMILNDKTNEITSIWLPSIVVVNNLVKDANFHRRAELNHVVAAEKSQKEYQETRMVNYRANMKKNKELYEKLISSTEERNLYNEAMIHWDAYLKETENIINLSRQNKYIEAGNSIRDVSSQEFNKLLELLNKCVAINEKGGSEATAQANDTFASAKTTIYVTTVFAIAMVISLGLFLANLIAKMCHKLQEVTKKVSQGNLNVNIDIQSHDELGNLADSFKILVGNFKNLIKKVINQTSSINIESDGLYSISNLAASASAELQAQSDTAATSSEQISANVSSVSTATEEMAASIKEISKNTQLAARLTKESEDRANQASEVMNRLGQSSQEIGHIVKSITNIAEQTNLLALNATIEAARAGELGKGFSVVANEVKELAKSAAKATEDITSKIKVIQDDSINAIEVIKSIIDNAIKVNEVSNSIASAIEEQSVTTSEVNRNLAEATKGVNSIVEVISGISVAANNYAIQANSIKTTSSSLKEMVNSLDKEIVANFTV
jgi:methyl-accepting chemotaxis protein